MDFPLSSCLPWFLDVMYTKPIYLRIPIRLSYLITNFCVRSQGTRNYPLIMIKEDEMCQKLVLNFFFLFIIYFVLLNIFFHLGIPCCIGLATVFGNCYSV